MIFGSRVSQSESSSVCSGSVTRACSYSQLPALPEVLSRSVHAPHTAGQDLKVRRTLVSHSATCLFSFDDSSSDSLLGSRRRICLISTTNAVYSSLVTSSCDDCSASFLSAGDCALVISRPPPALYRLLDVAVLRNRSSILGCTPWAAAVSSRSHSNLLTAISYQRFCLLLALLFCLRLARPWLFFFVLHVRLIRVLVLTSWLTDALSHFLPSQAAIGLLFLAPSTRCRLLLLCRFLVSARACLPRSLASSRLTETFWSSSSSSRHFRVQLLLQLHLVVVYCVVAVGRHSSAAVLYSATA